MHADYYAAVKSKASAGKEDSSIKRIHADDDSSDGVEQLISGKGVSWAPSNEVESSLQRMEIRQTSKQDSFSGVSFVLNSQTSTSLSLPQPSAPATPLPQSTMKSMPYHCSPTRSRGLSNLLAAVSRQVESLQNQPQQKNQVFGDKPNAEADMESSRQPVAGVSCLPDAKTALQSDSILISADCSCVSPYLASVADSKTSSGLLHDQAYESENNQQDYGFTSTLVWMNSSASGDMAKPWPVSTSGSRLDEGMPLFP